MILGINKEKPCPYAKSRADSRLTEYREYPRPEQPQSGDYVQSRLLRLGEKEIIIIRSK